MRLVERKTFSSVMFQFSKEIPGNCSFSSGSDY